MAVILLSMCDFQFFNNIRSNPPVSKPYYISC